MKNNMSKKISVVLSVVMMLICIILITSCSGIKITPGDDGGVVISPSGGNDNENTPGEDPNGDQNSENKHTHSYETVESEEAPSCTESGTIIWRCECGASLSETVSALGHDIRFYEGKAPSCVENGYEDYEKCSRGNCTYTTYKEIPALDHNYVALYDIAPTCTTNGATDRFKCMRNGCDYYTEKVVSALGHILEVVDGKPATCTESGHSSYEICSRNGCDGSGILAPSIIEALGHDIIHHSAKNPTCTEIGWNEYDTCQRCGYSTYEEIDPTGHNYINGYCVCGHSDLTLHTHIWDEGIIVVNATCTNTGTKKQTCTDKNCNSSQNVDIPALGHDNVHYEAKAPTCTEFGWEEYDICQRCDLSTYVKIEANGHSFENGYCSCGQSDLGLHTHLWNEGEIVQNATCTIAGSMKQTCTDIHCGDTQFIEIPALGHDDVHYEAKAPTCTEAGWKEYAVCKRCERTTYEQVSPTGHDYINGYCACGHSDLTLHTHIWDEGVVFQDATCTMIGSRTQTCTDVNCKETQSVDIPAYGHNYVNHEAKAPTCTADGWHAYMECDACGYNTYSVDPALGHSYDNGSITLLPTCTQSGICTFTCVRNGCTKSFTETIDKLGHDWGNWFVSKEATCTASGQEQRICFNDSTHIDNRTIAKLGHDWSDYNVVKNPTCTEEGRKKRTCNNDTLHEEFIPIPVVNHDVVLSTGICNTCKNVINDPLAIPVVNAFNNYSIFWNVVEGADQYQITVIYNGKEDTTKTTESNFNLETYFRECNSLEIKLRALSPEGSTTPHSEYFQHEYSIGEGSIVGYEGVGKTVNLLENFYTNYGNDTKSIFNMYLFNRLMASDKVTLASHYNDIVYSESISDYTNKLTIGLNNKMSNNASVGIDKLFKVTAGYSFEVDSTYEKKTYNQTQAVFYDAYYEYLGYQAGIDGFNNPEILYSLLSDEFLEDAKALENGEMTPEAFIGKYGTHVITSGIYGAKFNVHYEMLASKAELEANGKVVTKASVTTGIEGILKGISFGGGNEYSSTLSIEDFVSSTNADSRTVFEISAIGGKHIAPAITLSDFAKISEDWANSMTNENDYVLIDVPDGSLYFVWDFLSDEYSIAKEILDRYFYTRCDQQSDALNDKINGMYKNFFKFDEETGILTFDFSACQEPETDITSLKDVLYTDGNTVIFDGSTGKFRIYSKFNGYDVNKVVFEGGYLTRESKNNQLIESFFEDVYIVFGEDWTSDKKINLEFRNFAYHAPAGYSALDFSGAGADEITITLTGNNEIVGGVGSGEGVDGNEAINAPEKKLVFDGDGSAVITGGTGGKGKRGSTPKKSESANGGTGKKGATGGIGIVADTIMFSAKVSVNVNGGTGGRGGNGGNSVNGYWGSKNPGGKGGTGGTGGLAISANTICIGETAVVTAIGGAGGNGGKGGYRDTRYANGDVGAGGTAGTGGEALVGEIKADGVFVYSTGNAGSKGAKGGSWYTPDDYGKSKYMQN